MKIAIMVMGVSGCGKSTIGAALADAIDGVFLDGDDYHPQTNIEHMAAGKPLTDDMRWPWLDALSGAVQTARSDHVTVFACSALKKAYRDRLRAAIPKLKIAYLDAPKEVLIARIAEREHQYMPASLLESQLATLEIPHNPTISVDVAQPISAIVGSLKGLS